MTEERWCPTCNGGPSDHESDCPNSFSKQSVRALAQESLTLSLSSRDAQWLAAALGVCATLLSTTASDEVTAFNLDSLSRLFEDHYSGSEAQALTWRTRALLPLDTMLTFNDGPFAVPAPTQLQ